MTNFRDHADAMRVIGATFAGHALFDTPCQSWMVRRVMVPETGEPIASSAYHFVVTWLPGRALIVTGDIGSTVYSGITHLASLEETVRLVREADMDYLSRKSTHRKEYDPAETARSIVERAYQDLRHGGSETAFETIGDAIGFHGSFELPCIRKRACRSLLSMGRDGTLDQDTAYEASGNDCEFASMSWPSQAHWHYEALRTWARRMARMRVSLDGLMAGVERAAILAKIKIRTENVYPPIPIRDYDWSAVDDNTYDGEDCPIGWGRTEQAAINDLIDQLSER